MSGRHVLEPPRISVHRTRRARRAVVAEAASASAVLTFRSGHARRAVDASATFHGAHAGRSGGRGERRALLADGPDRTKSLSFLYRNHAVPEIKSNLGV